MSKPKKIYWDSSCFICFLNRDAHEVARRLICEDILQHARRNEVELYTSTWTVVEVIRPKKHGAAPLPQWAEEAIIAIEKKFPQARQELETLWNRYQSRDPAQKLTPAQAQKIQDMFEWDFMMPVRLDPPLAEESVKLARACGLHPADAIHAASAIAAKVDILQRWDRDFDKVAHLISVEDPQEMSQQTSLLNAIQLIGPTPEDFEDSNGNGKATDESAATQAVNNPTQPVASSGPKLADEGEV